MNGMKITSVSCEQDKKDTEEGMVLRFPVFLDNVECARFFNVGDAMAWLAYMKKTQPTATWTMK